jgi:hypothetical protein
MPVTLSAADAHPGAAAHPLKPSDRGRAGPGWRGSPTPARWRDPSA